MIPPATRSPGKARWSAISAFALGLGCSGPWGDDPQAATRGRARHTGPPDLRAAQAEIVLVGDTMYDGRLKLELNGEDPSFRGTLEPVRALVQAADLAFFNLETTVGALGTPLDKPFTFNSPVAALEALAWAGFDVASVANNHILDYGPDGLEITLAHLDELGFLSAGISRADQPQVPVIVEAGALEIGVLAYADAGEPFAYAEEFFDYETRPAEADRTAIARDLEALLPRVDVVFVSIHWGRESAAITERQRQLGHFIIDHGAILVAGHHPHVVQNAELYAGGLILYSLGNFVFGLWSEPRHLESRLYRIEVQPSGIVSAGYVELVTHLETWAPTPVSQEFVSVVTSR